MEEDDLIGSTLLEVRLQKKKYNKDIQNNEVRGDQGVN